MIIEIDICFHVCFRIFISFPKLTSEGYRVSISRLRNADAEKYVFSDHIEVSFMSMDIRMSKLDMFKKEIFLYDLSGYTMSHISLVLPNLKKMLYCVNVSTFHTV